MKRLIYESSVIFLLVMLAVTAIRHVRPIFIWNATASTPVGLYAVRPRGVPRVGVLVAVKPPKAAADFLERGGYLPSGVPLLKQVAATSGQRVCRRGVHISVDGRAVGGARLRDSHGRALPVWNWCHRLIFGETFLMNAAVPDSLDGRYFGPFLTRSIIGRLHPVWTDDARDGTFHWHGFTAPKPQLPTNQGDDQ